MGTKLVIGDRFIEVLDPNRVYKVIGISEEDGEYYELEVKYKNKPYSHTVFYDMRETDEFIKSLAYVIIHNIKTMQINLPHAGKVRPLEVRFVKVLPAMEEVSYDDIDKYLGSKIELVRQHIHSVGIIKAKELAELDRKEFSNFAFSRAIFKLSDGTYIIELTSEIDRLNNNIFDWGLW